MRTINCIKFDASYVNERGQEEIVITNVPDFARVQIGARVLTLGELISITQHVVTGCKPKEVR